MNPLIQGIGMEMIYSFVIIVCSLMIYFSTKELYELSSYKGIKYFRQSFLFFALAYFFRSFIIFVLIFFEIPIRDLQELGIFILFIFMYSSTMAIFYLLYSILWKKWNNHKNKILLLHFIAIVISLISISIGAIEILLTLQIGLFLFVTLVNYFSYKKSKKKNRLYAIYILLFAFWILNIIDILISIFPGELQLFVYFSSIGIFLMILYKVLKKTN